jgi:hypothetical protein
MAMTIVFKMLPDGGFLAGDTETRRTTHADPKSLFSTKAQRAPARVAADLMAAENDLRSWRDEPKYIGRDTVRWLELEGKTQWK